MNFRVKESENWPTEEDLEPHVYANGRFDVGDCLHVEWQVFMKDNLPKKAIPFVKLNQSEISKNRWGRDTFFCEIWNMSGGRFSMIDIQKLTTAEYYKITHELEEMENVWDGKYNESKHDSRKRIQEAQANMAYYGFKRVPERDFSDDGTRFFMWVWDPEDTGHSPFYFSKAGGYDMVFFSEHFGSNVRQECRKHGYNNLDDLNGISKSAFTDEALGKIVAQLQSIRESDWFESLCPEFSTRGAIDQGIEVKDYNADKDHQRVMDFAKRAGGDTDKMIKLAANMAKAIKDEEKMRSRWQAAVDIYGSESPVAKAFEAQANANHWHINIRPRSGDIDWSSLFESTIRENVKDESIYNAHAEYEKDQLKKKEEEDNQENFTFDEGSVKLTTVKESNNVAFYLCYDDDKETYLISKDYVNDDWNVEFKDISSLDEIKNLMPKLNALANEKVPYWRVTSRNHGDFGETMFLTKEAAQASYEKDREYWKSMDYSSTFYKYKKPLKKILSGCSYSTSDDDKINYIKSLPWTPSENEINKKFSESKKIKESMEHPYDILIAKKESEKGKSIEDKWRYADEVQISLDRVNDSHLYKVCPIFDGAVLYYWNEDGSINNIDEVELGMAVERFIQGYKDFDIEIAGKELLPILSKGQSDFINKKLFGLAERKYWNKFFDKLTESADGDRIEDLLKDYFDTTDVELSDETCWGLPVYVVDNMRYAVGDADEAYEAAVKQAISIYEDDTDEGKINWLQEHHWPGVDERGVCEACGDDPDDYEEGETIYQPSSIDEYIETMGFSQASDAFSMAFLGDYINKREIGEYVVDNDGVGALASEDGNEISIGDDLSAFCLGRAY